MVEKDEQSSFDPFSSAEKHKEESKKGDYHTQENSVGTHLIPSKRLVIKKESILGVPAMNQSDCDLERDLESGNQLEQMEFAPRHPNN